MTPDQKIKIAGTIASDIGASLFIYLSRTGDTPDIINDYTEHMHSRATNYVTRAFFERRTKTSVEMAKKCSRSFVDSVAMWPTIAGEAGIIAATNIVTCAKAYGSGAIVAIYYSLKERTEQRLAQPVVGIMPAYMELMRDPSTFEAFFGGL